MEIITSPQFCTRRRFCRSPDLVVVVVVVVSVSVSVVVLEGYADRRAATGLLERAACLGMLVEEGSK
jgi:hypothetical protein